MMSGRLLTPFRLLVVVIVTGLSAIMLRPDVLATMGVSFHQQWFLDSYAILAANDAAQAGLDTTHENPLDPLNRPHVYSDWWLGLRRLGLTRANNFTFGVICGLAFLVVALAGLRPATYRAAAFLAAAFLAPPTLIALQRANNDLLIFVLLGAGLLGLRAGSSPARLAWFGGLVILATGLKYYPLAAAGALLTALPWRRSTLWAFLLTAGGALFALFSERTSIDRGMFVLPQTIYEFGAPVLWRDLALGRGALAGLTLALFGLAVAGLWRQGQVTGLADEARGPEGERLLFAVGACLLAGCFLAGTSYVYRWIFGLWLWPWLWREAAAGRTPARVALVFWLVSIWADGALCLVVNSLGLGYRPGAGWRIVTQAITWGLMVLLAVWLLEGIIAQARARFRPVENLPTA
ncbi:MAG: hypothetical protein WDM96_12455 [Lacunisphaera sp.]